MSMNPEQLLSDLRRGVEELAMQMVLEDTPLLLANSDSLRSLAERLAEFSRQASSAGRSDAAQIASELSGCVRDAEGQPGPSSTQLESTLESGITRLQQVLSGAAVPAPESQSACSIAQDPELIADFVLESREHLENIENQVLALERNPSDPEALNSIFRGFHTIKGLAGFLELHVIQEVAHNVETLLDLARTGAMAISVEVIEAILAGADYLGQAVAGVDAELNGRKRPACKDHRGVLDHIHAVLQARPDPVPAQMDAVRAKESVPDAAAIVQRDDYEVLLPDADSVGEPEAKEPQRPKPLPPVAGPAAAEPGVRSQGASGNDVHAVRVDTAKLDYLVDMVGEMVIAQSLVRHDPDLAMQSNPRLGRNLSQLARITGEVQKTAMAMRMVPIRQLFQRMARLVRDLGRKAGKQADLVTAGEDTELDRTIVEEIADPLMHMIRNAIDHGIEPPEARAEAGKPPTARVCLGARHEAGSILIEISDDGRGLDRGRILRKGVERNLVSPDAHLSDSEVFNLIFEPGFSTADQVTDVSGRGVGMDVVRKHIQKLRGRVHIESTAGKGTTFFLKLPLTLAIIDGLVVGVGKERYILPIFTVREMVRPTAGMVSTVQGRSEMALIRESLLPVIRLHKRFGVEPRSDDPSDSLLIVAESSTKRFCIMVDQLIGKQEVVIKSLGETLKNIPGVAGGAILGDGHVGLILDVDGIFREQSHV